MKKIILVCSVCTLLLAGCGNGAGVDATTDIAIESTEETMSSEAVLQESAPAEGSSGKTVSNGVVNTKSAFDTSFRKIVGEEKDVLYLGHPRKLTAEEKKLEWSSSDETIASVEAGAIKGWREGLVTVTGSKDGEVKETYEFAVTTFNDGKQADVTYEYGRGGFIPDKDYVFRANLDPQYIQTHINTIQDSLYYLQDSEFEYIDDFLMAPDTDWFWDRSGEMIVSLGGGGVDGIANAAAYLLMDDFEDAGYIAVFGKNGKRYNWFYEDGTYYVISYSPLLVDIIKGNYDGVYEAAKFSTAEEVRDYIIELNYTNDVCAIIMFSHKGNSFIVPFAWSYVHDSDLMYADKVEIKVQDTVLEDALFTYLNPDFHAQFVGVPIDELPDCIPKYGDIEYYPYE